MLLRARDNVNYSTLNCGKAVSLIVKEFSSTDIDKMSDPGSGELEKNVNEDIHVTVDMNDQLTSLQEELHQLEMQERVEELRVQVREKRANISWLKDSGNPIHVTHLVSQTQNADLQTQHPFDSSSESLT